MKLELEKGSDDYAFKARVLPACIVFFPLITTVIFVTNRQQAAEGFISICAGFGLVFLSSNLVRSLGKRVEPVLENLWDGLPTTRMLRFSTDQNQALFRHRRAGLERLIGKKLPSQKQEMDDQLKSDQEYKAAVQIFKAKVRGSSKTFPRVKEENTNYGFRRNLFALKPYAIIMLVLTVVVAAGVAFSRHSYGLRLASSLAIDVVLGFVWLAMVNEPWVRQAAESYAERLFDVLDEGI